MFGKHSRCQIIGRLVASNVSTIFYTEHSLTRVPSTPYTHVIFSTHCVVLAWSIKVNSLKLVLEQVIVTRVSCERDERTFQATIRMEGLYISLLYGIWLAQGDAVRQSNVLFQGRSIPQVVLPSLVACLDAAHIETTYISLAQMGSTV